MNPIKAFFTSRQRHKNNQLRVLTENATQNKSSFVNSLTYDDEFNKFYLEPHSNSYLLHAWVNIAVNILIRNIARADFTIKNGGEDISHGQVFDLFHKPNPTLSRFDLWKETAASAI